MILNVLTRRKPAWTDRVLYMAPPDVKVAQVAYRSHPEITMSDHLPVSADFDVSVRAHGVFVNAVSNAERRWPASPHL